MHLHLDQQRHQDHINRTTTATILPEVVVRFEAAGGAERPARAAVVLVLHLGHGSELPPVAPGGRRAAVAQVKRAVLAILAVVGRRAVLAHAEGAAKPQACRLELLPDKSVGSRR